MRRNEQIIGLAFSVIAAAAMMIYITGCGLQKAGNEKLNVSVSRAFEDAYNKGEIGVLDKFVAADVVRHFPPNPDIKGLEAYKQAILKSRSDYPVQLLTVHSTIMEGNTSASRWTHQFTIGTTGKQIIITGCSMYRWENGKIVEQWLAGDLLGRYRQLGYTMLPPLNEKIFARVTITQMKPEKREEAIKIYKESLVPEAKKQKGFRSIMSLSDFKTGKGISISIWDSEADAVANEQNVYYKEQVGKFKDLYTAKPVREGYTVTVQE
jgi:predicted ester cyclase/heme-degrading monooxygenase HmoA